MTDASNGTIELYDETTYRNGDVSAVLLTDLGNGYQAIAIEVDAGGQFLASEEIGHAEERDTAEGMCKYWIEQHPAGILGFTDEDSGGGLLAGLLGGDSGNETGAAPTGSGASLPIIGGSILFVTMLIVGVMVLGLSAIAAFIFAGAITLGIVGVPVGMRELQRIKA